MKTIEDRSMTKLDFVFSFKNILFGHILEKLTHSFFGARSFCIGLKPSQGPHAKAL